MEKEEASGRYGSLVVVVVLLSILAILVFGLIVVSDDVSVGVDNSGDMSEYAIVEEVIDGMTIRTSNSTIRLSCLDSPEQGELFYEEAKAFLSGKILGENVSLKSSDKSKDNSGRELRYVYLSNALVNKEVVLNGFAQVKNEGNSSSGCKELERYQEEAMREKRGIWAIENYTCDRDYYNCNNFSNPVQAQLVLDFCGSGQDVHLIDNDGDGVACE